MPAILSVISTSSGTSPAPAPTVEAATTPENDEVNRFLATGDQFRNSGLPLKAIEQYEKALAIDDENPGVYQRLGYALIQAEDYVAAASGHRGATSGAQEYVVFGRNEPALHHYHDTYRAALGLPPLEAVK